MKFTAQDVLRAYREKGLVPSFGMWNIVNSGGTILVPEPLTGRKQCCALSALCVGEEVPPSKMWYEETFDPAEQVGLVLGMTEQEVEDFVAGFDGDGCSPSEAWYLGNECRDLVIREFKLDHYR